MIIKYDAYISDDAVYINLKRLTNQIYKLLPNREEEVDWQKPLDTIIEELAGMHSLLINYHDILFSLLCKLEGLRTLTEKRDFPMFRRTIFECLSLINTLKNSIKEESPCQD